MLSEISQTQMDTHCLIPLTGGPSSSQNHGTESRMMGVRGWGMGSQGFMAPSAQPLAGCPSQAAVWVQTPHLYE